MGGVVIADRAAAGKARVEGAGARSSEREEEKLGSGGQEPHAFDQCRSRSFLAGISSLRTARAASQRDTGA